MIKDGNILFRIAAVLLKLTGIIYNFIIDFH